MSIVLINADEEGQLASNYAKFKNSENPAHNKGECWWGDPIYNEEAERWEIPNVYGINAQNQAFDAGTLVGIPEEKTITPTDVFWWIADTIKTTLCPSCM